MASQVIKCVLCEFLSPSLDLHISHLRLVHSTDSSFCVRCDIDGCLEEFRAFSAYNSHIYRKHRVALGLEKPTEIEVDAEREHQYGHLLDIDESHYEQQMDEQQMDEGGLQWQLSRNAPKTYTEKNAEFLMSLTEGKQLSQASIEEVIEGCRSICKQAVSQYREKITQKLQTAGVDPSMTSEIDETDPFEGLHTPYLRKKYYREHFGYLEPEEKPFGEAYYSVQFSGPKRRNVLKADNFYYVSILDTLRTLMTLPEVQAEVLNPHTSNGSLSDFSDGSVFKQHPLFSVDSHAIQVVGYYDEVEVVNPIGSFVSKNKLGCIFFFLGNIRPRYRSTHKAINLVAVAKHKHIVKYGLDTFLSPFVEDLKTLYLDGISVSIGGTTRTFYGGLLAFLADNLAAHAVAGFKESMSFSLRMCRSCMVTGEKSQSCTSEEQCKLRDPETHFHQTQLLTGSLEAHYSTSFGINRYSILEDVPGFSVATCIPHDIMHDLYEGAVPYELRLLITHCVQENYFSIATLNDRIQRFDYVLNKPSLLDPNLLKTHTKIHQSAAQMMTLAHNFPLLIGDKVPENDEQWLSFLQLLKICDICLSPTCTPDTIAYLRLIIEEKLTTFNQVYPDAKIIPKLHYIIHYPSQIEKFGPLIHSWTMRHESKLSFVKRVSRRSNFKNVPKTVCEKHQLWHCYQVHSDNSYIHTDFEYGPVKVTNNLSNEDEHVLSECMRLFPTASTNIEVHHLKWVKVQSSAYKNGAFLLLQDDKMSSTFGKLVDIIKINGTVVFSLHIFVSKFFDSHYHSFVVEPTLRYMALSLDTIPYHTPLYSKQNFSPVDRNLYIVLY